MTNTSKDKWLIGALLWPTYMAPLKHVEHEFYGILHFKLWRHLRVKKKTVVVLTDVDMGHNLMVKLMESAAKL